MIFMEWVENSEKFLLLKTLFIFSTKKEAVRKISAISIPKPAKHQIYDTGREDTNNHSPIISLFNLDTKTISIYNCTICIFNLLIKP